MSSSVHGTAMILGWAKPFSFRQQPNPDNLVLLPGLYSGTYSVIVSRK